MITKNDIEKLAQLSRIDISEGEIKELCSEIESILEYVSEVQDVSSSEPEKKAGELRNVLREDDSPHESGMYTEVIMNEAPEQKDGYIKVKAILTKR
ncbi:Asp-tRNA(Asn)/Glu-tRNA(Gln) amidotransferase subunit GatC [Patescibacteria group bacterium]|nr:Asp-tRNA(Asn)/Glu-tRNA(Gln) amidotransferase subunit GatC [Patescibacteria group bacterium]